MVGGRQADHRCTDPVLTGDNTDRPSPHHVSDQARQRLRQGADARPETKGSEPAWVRRLSGGERRMERRPRYGAPHKPTSGAKQMTAHRHLPQLHTSERPPLFRQSVNFLCDWRSTTEFPRPHMQPQAVQSVEFG